jgi:hypothetical protein
MLARALHFLKHLLATALLLGTAAGQPAMVLGSVPARAMAGHHHHHDAEHPAAPANSCCEFCWTACATAPGAPQGVELAAPVLQAMAIGVTPVARAHVPVPVPHTLPFSQGPPALLA